MPFYWPFGIRHISRPEAVQTEIGIVKPSIMRDNSACGRSRIRIGILSGILLLIRITSRLLIRGRLGAL